MLKIAVPNKGRLQEDALGILRKIGLRARPGQNALLQNLHGGEYQLLFVRSEDIPEYVELGAADLGITGLDLVNETNRDVDVLMDLEFGKCRLVAAVPEGSNISNVDEIPDGATVATSFPLLTETFFKAKNKDVKVVTVSGATELTPAVGLADLITDLVQSGGTLKRNHLVELDTILESSCVVLGNRNRLQNDRDAIDVLLGALESVLTARKKRYLMANVPSDQVDAVGELIPGVSGPTVMQLAGNNDTVAVHAVVPEDHINKLIPELKKLGAAGILILPIERMVP
jgi:ATP phosphoribosyltransferase